MDYMCTGLVVAGALLIVVGILWVIISLVSISDERDNEVGRENKRIIAKGTMPVIFLPLIGLLLLLGRFFVPNTKEMCAIKAIPIVMNDEGVQELPHKVVNLANDWMEELRPDKELAAKAKALEEKAKALEEKARNVGRGSAEEIKEEEDVQK
jgi:hypothetical protein